MAQLEKSIHHCDSQKIQLFEDYHDGKIDRESVRSQKQILVQRQEELRKEYAACEEQYAKEKREAERQQKEQDQLREFLSGGDLPDDAAIEKMYGAIDRVLVFDNKHIEVRWKFEDLFRIRPDCSEQRAAG